ncbi:MAG TPA: GAF domain-containing sensor histidine kinase, partial [Polyangia bacterium]
TARQAAEAAQSRLLLLAQVSAEIASSLDERQTMQSAARVATPSFARLCVLYHVDEDGKLHQGAVAAADGAELDAVGAALAEPPALVDEVIRGGRTRVVAAPPLGWPALEALGAHALVCAPLVVRGCVLGALVWARDRPMAPFGSDDVSLAEEIGRRAGVAIDNARLFQRTDHALRWRDEFLSVASHELRTPVTSLSLSAQNLESMAADGTLATAPPGMVARGLATVVRQARHLGHLIEELLDLTRIQAGRFEVAPSADVDLVAVVRAATGRLARQLTIAGCTLTIAADRPVVGFWDRTRLEQVVTNLVTNAMKFGAGQPIEIAVGAADHRASLAVTDHGIGIPPDQQALIFDRFQRGGVSSRHYAGLGLGLHIVRQIVEAHHGAIAVASTPGRGSTFTVTLPTDGA